MQKADLVLPMPLAKCSLSLLLCLSLALSFPPCLLSDSGLLVHSSDKAGRVAVRENGRSKAPYLQSEHLLPLKNISKEIKLSQSS